VNKDFSIKLKAKIDSTASNVTELNKQIKDLEKKVKSLEIKVKMPTGGSKGFGELDTQLKKLKVNMREFSDNVLNVNTNFDTTTTKYTNNAGKILTITEKMVDGNKRYKVSLKEVGNVVDTSAKQADKWKYSWGKAFQSFTTYMSVSTLFYQLVGAVKTMVNEVADLDEALVELKKVTDLEGASLDNFVKKAYEAGETVAKTGTEMIEAATEFAKAGYKDEALELGTIAAMYTNIADESISAADSANVLISQMKAFNIEAEDAIHIIDAINEVSNNFAVSSSDIAKNLGKSSAVMANAGNSMEQMIGLLTAGTEITRNAGKVANGLKTITLRLQGMNDEGEESLELQAQMEALFSKLGISVYDANGALKNTYDIMGTLAGVYQDLTAAEKAYVTETIAGKFQAQNAAAILNNWQTAIDATATALNSQGSAMEENEKVLDSIKGKTAAFKSAVEQLSKSLIDSGLIKWVIELGTTLVKFAGSGFGVFMLKASLTFLALKGGTMVFQNLTKNTKEYVGLIPKLTQSFIALTKSERDLGKYLTVNQKGFAGLTAEEKRKQIADVKAAATTTALNAALALSAIVITGVISKYQDYQRKQQEAAQQTLDNLEKTQDKIKDLDSTASTVESLRKTLDDSSSSYKDARSAREELIKIQDELISKYGIEADKIDLVSGSVEEQIKKLKQLKAEYAAQQLAENESGYNTARDKVYGKNSYTRDIVDLFHFRGTKVTSDMKDILKQYGKVTNVLGEVDWVTKSVDASKKGLEEWKKYLQTNHDMLLKTGQLTQKEYEKDLAYIDGELKNIKDKYNTYYETLEKQKQLQLQASGFDMFKDDMINLAEQQAITKDSVEDLISKYPGLKEALEENGYTIEKLLKEYQDYNKVTEMISKEGSSELIDKLKELASQTVITEEDVNNLKNAFGEELGALLESTGLTFDEFIEKFRHAAEQSHSLLGVFSTLKNTMDGLEKGFGYLKNAVDEFNTEGYITAETLNNLMQTDLLQYLEFTEDGLIANTNALKDEAEMAKFTALVNLKAAFAQDALAIATGDVTNASQTGRSIMQGFSGDVSDAGIIAEAASGKFFKLGAGIIAANEAAKKGKKDIDITGEVETQLAQLESVYNKYAQAIAATNFSGSGGKYKGSSSSSSSSSSSTKEWWETELSKLKEQYKYNEITIDEYINALNNLLGRVGKGTDAWRQINEELQKQRLSKVEDDYKRGAISLDEYINKLKELIKAYREGTDAWNELADKIKKGLQDKAKQQKDDLKTAEQAAVGLIDEEIKRLEELRDAEKDRYDDLIESKKKANDETEREIELARLQEALENAKNEKVKRVWYEGRGWVWEADQKAIQDAQDALDSFLNDAAITDLENQRDTIVDSYDDEIDALKKYKEAWNDVADDYEKQQDRIVLAQQLGADAEHQLLLDRLTYLEEYRDKYLATMKEIEDYEKKTSTVLAGGSTGGSSNSGSSGGGGSSAAPSLTQGSYVSVKSGAKWYENSYGGGRSGTAKSGTIKYVNMNGSHPYNIDGLGWVRKSDIVGYADGGVVDYTGLAMLHGTKSKPEFVLNNDQFKNIMSNIGRPQSISGAGNKSHINNYNFGNIELPNVTNARQFMTELRSLINITKHQ